MVIGIWMDCEAGKESMNFVDDLGMECRGLHVLCIL